MAVSVKGVTATIQAAENLLRKQRPAVGRALRIFSDELLTTAKEEFVPVDVGELQASGRVIQSDVERRVGPQAIVSFGGEHPAGGYAIAVHEIPARHRIGSDKYLEKPALRDAYKLEDEIETELKRAIF